MAISTSLAAAAAASVITGSALHLAQRRLLANLQGICQGKARAVVTLEEKIWFLEAKASEFEAVPKMMSVKRREAQELAKQDIAALQAKNAESGQHLSCIQERLEEVPKLISITRRQTAALEAKSTEKSTQLEQLHEEMRSDVEALQAQAAEQGERLELHTAQLEQDVVGLREQISELSAQLAVVINHNTALQKRVETMGSKSVNCFSFRAAGRDGLPLKSVVP